MKAKILFLAAAVALALSPVFGMAKNNKKAQVTGVVEYYGNAPFSRLGLKTQDGTLYYLDADKDVQDKLGELHGCEARVDGILTDEKAPVEIPSAIVLNVKSWKKL